MSTSTQAIEESIKIALDAADTATGITAEFETIRSQFDQARKEVKTVNRHALGIFASSVVAIVIATGAASFMYFRTLGEMRAASTTTMEGLLIFAENVDKLVVAIDKVEALEATNAQLLAALQATTGSIEGLSARMQEQPAAVSDQVLAVMSAPDSPLEAMAARVADRLDAGFATQAEASAGLSTAIAAQTEVLQTLATAPQGGQETVARLDAMILLQQEVSAKLTALQARATAPAPSAPRPQTRTSAPARPAAPAAPSGDVIKFP